MHRRKSLSFKQHLLCLEGNCVSVGLSSSTNNWSFLLFLLSESKVSWDTIAETSWRCCQSTVGLQETLYSCFTADFGYIFLINLKLLSLKFYSACDKWLLFPPSSLSCSCWSRPVTSWTGRWRESDFHCQGSHYLAKPGFYFRCLFKLRLTWKGLLKPSPSPSIAPQQLLSAQPLKQVNSLYTKEQTTSKPDPTGSGTGKYKSWACAAGDQNHRLGQNIGYNYIFVCKSSKRCLLCLIHCEIQKKFNFTWETTGL